MSDITKTFFLAHDPFGENPFRGVNHIPLQSSRHSLVFETFKPGDGTRMQAFLTGDIRTGEQMPRKLPKEVANKVAQLVNEDRHSRGHYAKPGYVIQVVATGGSELHWTLEKISLKAGRYDRYYAAKKFKHDIGEAINQEKGIVSKSDLKNLVIKEWDRAIHYTINIITFGRYTDMEMWAQHYAHIPQFAPFLKISKKEPSEWFKLLNWQRLPTEFIDRMDSGAKEFVFPTNWQMIRHAVHKAQGPIYVQPITFFFELANEHSEHGPQNCVHTLFKADIKIVLGEGII
jgi:hypothetical protein